MMGLAFTQDAHIRLHVTMIQKPPSTTVPASMPWKDVKLAQGNLMGLGLWSGVTWMATVFVISTKLKGARTRKLATF